MNRRSLLSATPAVMALASAGIGRAGEAAAPSPDADLIALCAQLDNLERAYLASDFEDDAADPKRKAIAAAQAPFVDAICVQPPQTLPGFLALARSLALWSPDAVTDPGSGGYTDDRLLSALLRAAVATPPAAAPTPHPDAELLALCADFHRVQASYRDDDNPEWDRSGPAAHAAFVAVQGVTPATEAGHRAKGWVALAKLEENHGDGMAGDPYAEFALTMLRDWLGEAA